MALALRCSTRWLGQPGVLSAGAVLIRSFGTQPDTKIYEMRRYKIKPDKYTEFIRLAREKYEEVMMPHGKLVGYWATSMGSLNEVHHLWEYGTCLLVCACVRVADKRMRLYAPYCSLQRAMLTEMRW